jgi:hypothetical protein
VSRRSLGSSTQRNRNDLLDDLQCDAARELLLVNLIAAELRNGDLAQAFRARFVGRPCRIIESDFVGADRCADTAWVIAVRLVWLADVLNNRFDAHLARLWLAQALNKAVVQQLKNLPSIGLGYNSQPLRLGLLLSHCRHFPLHPRQGGVVGGTLLLR